MRLADRLRAVKADTTGATAVEYALMVGFVAIAIIAAVASFGGGVVGLFAGLPF